MWRILALIAVLWTGAAEAQLITLTGAGSTQVVSGGFTPSCPDSGTWLARTSGLSPTERDAYDVMICGMEANNVGCSSWANAPMGANIDLLYIFATNNTTTAGLNLCSTTPAALTPVGTNFPSGAGFTPDVGYQGDGSTDFLYTGLVAAPLTNFTQNSASFGAYILNNRTGTSNSYCEIANNNSAGNSFSYIAPNNLTVGFQGAMTSSGPGVAASGETSSQGAWVVTRPSSGTVNAYKNGISTAIATASDTSTSIGTATVFFISSCAFALGETPSNFSADKIAAVFVGGAETGTQAVAINNAINGYMTALSINVYSPTCSAAATWLGRVSGLSSTEINAYTGMICGMIADGSGCSAWSGFSGAMGTGLDALYIAATNTTTTANLNLCSTSYPLTLHGTVAFSADNGYTGNGTNGFFSTAMIPSSAGGNYVLNGSAIGSYILTSSTSSDTMVDVGTSNVAATSFSNIIPANASGPTFVGDMNDATFPTLSTSNIQGFSVVNRASSGAMGWYRNGVSIATPASTSVTLPDREFYIGAWNTGSPTNFSTHQWSAAFIGGNQATNIASLSNRINGYMTVLGINTYTPFTPGCTASAVWLARTSGLSTTERNAYDHMICVDMIPNGIGCAAWSGSSGNTDAFYIFATNTTTTANLNLCSTSYGVTVGASTVTFAADHGYTGDGTSGYLDTNFDPTAGTPNYSQNSASISAYVLTSADGSGSKAVLGQGDGGMGFTYMAPLLGGTVFSAPVNFITGSNGTASESSAIGAWISDRSGASTVHGYKNGSSTPVFTDATASAALVPSITFKIGAATLGSMGAASNFSADQIAAIGIGGSRTSVQDAAWNNAINNYMTALGVNVY